MPHPSILIGYGAYGLRVLQSFLVSAAGRGALVWDEQGNVGSLNERRLRSLSLFWVPEASGQRDQQASSEILGESSYELMDDLYAQIEILEGSFDEIRQRLAEGVNEEKKRLLDARTQLRVLGLDVFVLAQPVSQEVIGSVRDLMEPTMKILADDPAFATVQGSPLLNFTQIFDFEDYWAPRAEPVRLALHQAVEDGEDAVASGRPAVGRIYLFDGLSSDGHRRSFDSRKQEVTLFLELLLLEGVRNEPDMRMLFERQHPNVSPICAVGVRAVERSSGLLRRLAAAAFARGWLDYISSTAGAGPGSPFAELAAPFRGERLDATLGESELRKAAAVENAAIEVALVGISPDQPDWGARLRETAMRRTEEAILRLARQSGARSEILSQKVLRDFREKLEQTIASAMQERSPALTLGSVIEELQCLEQEFGAALSPAVNPGAAPELSDAPFDEASRMQREYMMHGSRQVQTAVLANRWWPVAAIMFAIAVSPVLLRGISDLWPDPLIPVWALALLCAVALGLLFQAFGRFGVQPALATVAARAREFYSESERGRLAERARQAAASPAIAGRIEAYGVLLNNGLRQYILGALVAEFRRARLLLLQRREEVQWLRRQVGEFLLSYQVDDSQLLPVFLEDRVKQDVRLSLERSEDLEAVAQSQPRSPDRFRELVAAKQLFESWHKAWCDTFLHPLPFLDSLSDSFQDRLELEGSEIRRRAGQIAAYLENEVRVPACFSWFAADGLPSPDKGCLFPTSWISLPGVNVALTSAGFGNRIVESSNSERLYVFQSMLGVPRRLLV